MTMAMESDVSRRAALGALLAGAASIPGTRAPLPRPNVHEECRNRRAYSGCQGLVLVSCAPIHATC